MPDQQSIDLEARIGELERQLAELAAKVNPLYSGGMDRYIHSGYLQFDGIPMRWGTNGMQIESNGVTRIGLRFMETLQADPTDIFPRGELRGSATSAGNSGQISLRAVSSEANGNISYVHVIAADSASLAELVTSDTSVGTASMGVHSEDADDHPYSFAIGGPFSLPPLSTDPTGSPLVDGMIWYNTTANQLKARVNGSTVILA